MKKVTIFITTLTLMLCGCSGSSSDNNTSGSSNGDNPFTVGNSNDSYDEGSDTTTNGNDVEEQYTITYNEATTLELVDYSSSVLSMKIPQGWVMEEASMSLGILYGFHLYDPNNPINQIIYINKAEPLWHNQDGKDFMISYGEMTGMSDAIEVGKAPVLTNPTFESFMNIYNDYAYYMKNYYGGTAYSALTLNDINNFTVLEELPYNTPLTSLVLDSTCLHSTFTQNGVAGEGLFAGDVADFKMPAYPNGIDGGYYMIYNIVMLTSEDCNFVNYESLLRESYSSIVFSDEYLELVAQQLQISIDQCNQIFQTAQEVSDIISNTYSSRETSLEVTRQKQSDATLGYQRVYDNETGEYYLASINYDFSDSSRYEVVTDDNAYLAKISGWID